MFLVFNLRGFFFFQEPHTRDCYQQAQRHRRIQGSSQRLHRGGGWPCNMFSVIVQSELSNHLFGGGLWCRMWLQRTSWPCWKVTSQKSKGAQEKSLKGKWINLTQQTPPNYQVLWVLLTFYNSSLGSGPNDHIFVYFTDHGAPGLLAFPDDEVTFLTLTFTRVTSRLYGNKLIWSCSAGLVW